MGTRMKLMAFEIVFTAVMAASPAMAQEPNDTVQLLLAKGGRLEIQGGSAGDMSFTPEGDFILTQPGGIGKLEGTYKVTGGLLCVHMGPDGVETCMTPPPGKQSGDRFPIDFGPGRSYLTLN